MKYGRQSLFSGPVGVNRGWCGKVLEGSHDFAGVALSTKYIPLHANSPNSQYCGSCLCVQLLATDETTNKYPPMAAKKYYGKIFKGRVVDACSECEDDHIDVLTDRPFSYAPVNKFNPKAKYYNSIPGPRLVPVNLAYGVGVWKVQWNFVDCNTNCNTFFR